MGKFGGKAGGKGKGNQSWGGGGGGWVFVPAAAPAWGGKSFAPFVAKGKGQDPRHEKAMEKIGKMDAEVKVWVGGLPKDVKPGVLLKHFKELDCKPAMHELLSKGSAVLAFKTADEASNAIALVNGTEIDGQVIEVDVWTKKEHKKKEKKERTDASGNVKKNALKKKPVKRKDLERQEKLSKILAEKMEAIDSAQKVKVTGLKASTTWKELKTHFVDSGCEVDLSDVSKPGTACLSFKSAAEASSAVNSMNGSELDGKSITVEAWE